ncbi:hypothetical protein CLMAG_61030 [Clostridium magnum DSM 2767]|uniref:Catalase n=2 Tax=Clostridium magnum TaxID=33954 RepID=A0A161W0I2_9CLOT|nr:hypothetical protein CLMAG_61030 [Clostridium magnum DSM 2767]SHI84849.1 hypothetical protein SAMN02745944_04956 [Clostridium magnum DSM 2767]
MLNKKIMNGINHFKTITNHKMLVMKYCFKIGLYKQGLLHDLSKYSWTEFSAGIKYYKGTMSPNAVQKIEQGYSEAWLHHKGRNKHHFEYWIDFGINPTDGLIGMKMPTRYVVEMFIDRMCASKNYRKENYTDRDALDYYNRGKNYCIMHKEAAELLELILNKLADEGEEATLAFIKNKVLK